MAKPKKYEHATILVLDASQSVALARLMDRTFGGQLWSADLTVLRGIKDQLDHVDLTPMYPHPRPWKDISLFAYNLACSQTGRPEVPSYAYYTEFSQEDDCFIGKVKEWPTLSAHADTMSEAILQIHKQVGRAIDDCLVRGHTAFPKPGDYLKAAQEAVK